MSAEENLKVWDTLAKTDPKHTTRFQRTGGFKGTAVKPIYTIHKMTEVYGPVGEGWGMSAPWFETVTASNGEVLVFCTVGLWIKDPNGIDGRFFGVGGDRVVVAGRDGNLRTNDEAYKMAYTDAVTNALKYLGMSADVHMGLFDDSKYVRDLEREFSDEPAPELAPAAAKRADQREIWGALRDEIDACTTLEDLSLLWTSIAFKKEFAKLGADWAQQLIDHKDEVKKALTPAGKPAYVQPNFEGLAK